MFALWYRERRGAIYSSGQELDTPRKAHPAPGVGPGSPAPDQLLGKYLLALGKMECDRALCLPPEPHPALSRGCRSAYAMTIVRGQGSGESGSRENHPPSSASSA